MLVDLLAGQIEFADVVVLNKMDSGWRGAEGDGSQDRACAQSSGSALLRQIWQGLKNDLIYVKAIADGLAQWQCTSTGDGWKLSGMEESRQ